MTAEQPLSGRVVLVTGASRGIGYFAAREAVRQGAHVVAVARTVGGLEELDDEIRAAGGSSTLVPLDLTDGDGIDRLGAALFERWGRLDGLVAGAALMGPTTPVAHLAPKDFDKSLALNVTANYRLIRSFDLLLRQSDAGRAVFLTSHVAQELPPFWAVYTATKAAMEAMVLTYARELKPSRVKVNLYDPGPLRTALRARGWPGEDAATLESAEVVAPEIARLISPLFTDAGRTFRRGDILVAAH